MKSKTILVLAMLFVSLLLVGGEAHGQLVGAHQRWWNSDWRFRTPILVTNLSNESRASVPVFFYLEFPERTVISAFSEMRTVDSGFEIPSYILYESHSGLFVRGAYVLTFLTLGAGEGKVLHVYYGNPSAPPPRYRSSNQIDSVGVGALRIELTDPSVESPDGRVLFSYGEAFEISALVKVGSELFSPIDHGPIQIASNRFRIVEDWRSVGNLTDIGYVVASSTFKARDIVLVRTIIVSGAQAWVSDLLVNEGPRRMDDLVIYDVYDAGGLSSLGPAKAVLNRQSHLLLISVGGTYVGVKSLRSASSFELSDPLSVFAHVRSGRLSGSTETIGSVGSALSHTLRPLEPGENSEVLRFWASGPSASNVSSVLEAMASAVTVYSLPSELPETPIPLATAVYESVVDFKNVSLSEEISFSMGLEDVRWVPHSVGAEGTLSYGVPGPKDYDFESPSIWEAERYSEEALAYASASHWFGDPRGHVGRVSVWAFSDEGAGNASLSSEFIKVYGASQVTLNLTYWADRVVYEGNTSQGLHVRLGFDYGFDDSVDTWLYLPVEGASTPEDGIVLSHIEAGRTWRSFSGNLSDYLISKDFQFKVDIVAASDAEFRGSLELNVDDLQLEVVANAKDVLRVSMDPFAPRVALSFVPGLKPAFAMGDVRVHFLVLDSTLMDVLQDGGFRSVFVKPSLVAVNFTMPVGEGLDILVVPKIVLLLSSYAVNSTSIVVDGSDLTLEDFSVREGTLVINDGVVRGDGPYTLEARFTIGTLEVSVTDASGRPLRGASVVVQDRFGNDLLASSTDSEGSVRFTLIPSSYGVKVLYHRVLLGYLEVSVSSESELSLLSRVYRLTFRALDGLGMPVSDARVQAFKAEALMAESTTTYDGFADIMLVGHDVYEVKVLVGGTEVLSREVRVSLDNATVLLKTSYYPLWFQLSVIAALAIAILTIILGLRKKHLKVRVFTRAHHTSHARTGHQRRP